MKKQLLRYMINSDLGEDSSHEVQKALRRLLETGTVEGYVEKVLKPYELLRGGTYDFKSEAAKALSTLSSEELASTMRVRSYIAMLMYSMYNLTSQIDIILDKGVTEFCSEKIKDVERVRTPAIYPFGRISIEGSERSDIFFIHSSLLPKEFKRHEVPREDCYEIISPKIGAYSQYNYTGVRVQDNMLGGCISDTDMRTYKDADFFINCFAYIDHKTVKNYRYNKKVFTTTGVPRPSKKSKHLFIDLVSKIRLDGGDQIVDLHGPSSSQGGKNVRHWCRAFWRNQPYGPGGKLRKRIIVAAHERGLLQVERTQEYSI